MKLRYSLTTSGTSLSRVFQRDLLTRFSKISLLVLTKLLVGLPLTFSAEIIRVKPTRSKLFPD